MVTWLCKSGSSLHKSNGVQHCAVGSTNSDIAGLGVSLPTPDKARIYANSTLQIIYAFVVQGGLSVVLSLVSVMAEAFQVLARQSLPQFQSEKSVKTLIICINAVLSSISQTQIVNGTSLHFVSNVRSPFHGLSIRTHILDNDSGISLLIAVIVQHDELSLYHLHIVYDVVNLTG